MSAVSSWRVDQDDRGLCTLWLDRPGSSHNSIDLATLDQLDQILARVEGDAGCRAVLLRSAKPKGFCAGADLREIAARRDAGTMDDFGRRGFDVFERLERLPIPTLAFVHGVCLGGGLELVLPCRYRLARAGQPPVLFGTPEVHLGLIPGWGGIGTLVRLVGLRPALKMLIDCESVGVAEAANIGLIEGEFDEGSLLEAVDRLTLGATSSTLLQWRTADWTAELNEVRDRLREARPDQLKAKLRLLDVLEAELTRGPDAGRDDAIRGLSELADTPEARAALDAFFNRKSSPSS